MVSLELLVGTLSLFGTIVVILISGCNLYLSHFRKGRSDLELRIQDTSGAGFSGGSRDKWEGNSLLKITNTGEKSGLLVDHRIQPVRLYKSPNKEREAIKDEVPSEVQLHIPDHMNRLPDQKRIQPNDLIDHRQHIRVTGTDVLERYDAIDVEHLFIVEDNKGSYNIQTEARLGFHEPGPK